MENESIDNRIKLQAKPVEIVTPDLSAAILEFEAACMNFRKICADIGEFIGKPNFTGGFDEMDEYEGSEKALTPTGLALAIKWMASNERCTYLGKKVGLGQPEWWKVCWEFYQKPEQQD